MSDKGTSDSATRDALERIANTGSDLTRPMSMDFFVAVPDRASGLKVAAQVRDHGFEARVEQDDDDGCWTCYCVKVLVPDYESVVAIERLLNSIAKLVGGECDGFGTFGNAEDS